MCQAAALLLFLAANNADLITELASFLGKRMDVETR